MGRHSWGLKHGDRVLGVWHSRAAAVWYAGVYAFDGVTLTLWRKRRGDDGYKLREVMGGDRG